MDRDELEERLRGRQPADAPFRRGQDVGAAPSYVPFEPEPEDALIREAEPQPALPPLDRSPDVAEAADRPIPRPEWEEPEPAGEPAWPEEPPRYEDVSESDVEPEADDLYAYPYPAPDDVDDRRGGGMLPLLGFAALAVMALAVGVILAGVIGGPGPVADATPTPTPSVATTPIVSEAPSVEATAAPSEPATSATPEPTDGPVAFPDGAEYLVQPCGTMQFLADLSGCTVDGSTSDTGSVWVLLVFDNAPGADELVVRLRSGQETIQEWRGVLGDIVDCSPTCRHGLIWGPIYRELQPGTYELVLLRNGEFADRAAFEVQG